VELGRVEQLKLGQQHESTLRRAFEELFDGNFGGREFGTVHLASWAVRESGPVG
jgi:hypothetical protein